MRIPIRTTHETLLGLAITMLMLSGCQKAVTTAGNGPSAQAAAPTEENPKAVKESGVSVTISAEAATQLGITSSEATAAVWIPESSGYGLVISHDGIAQAVADISTARAALVQSRAALTRIGLLANGAGALSAEARATAERQADIDAAALTLAERRLSIVVGEHPIWPKGSTDSSLTALASGATKLIRVTFPPASPLPQSPAAVRLNRVGAAVEDKGWRSSPPWPAPADPAMPGRSFFAMVSGGDLSEGERLEAWMPVGSAVQGRVIPSTAIVQSEGRYWCYVEEAPGKFRRDAVDTRRPLGEGYFVSDGFSAGQRIVTSAAGLLLARELNPSTGAE